MTGERVALRRLAGSSGGVLVVSTALAAGWSTPALRHALVTDGWRKVRRGVWAEPGRAVDLGVRLRAAQLGQPELVVSHSAAAVGHGVEVLAVRAEFTCAGRRQRAPAGGVLHRIALAEDEVATVAGLRVTTVPRTLSDLLIAAGQDEALVAVESALTRRPRPGSPGTYRDPLITLGGLRRALGAHGGRRGIAAARERLELADAQAGSPAETVARLRMYGAGLRPVSQAPFTAPNGRRIRVDFFFPAAGLVVEIEGYAFHGSRAAHARDIERFNDLARCPGVRRVVRFTAADIFRRPEWMLHTIRAGLEELA